MQIARKIASILLAVVLLFPVPAYAKDEEVFNEKLGPYKNGWTTKKQEAAEASLGITDWSSLGNFIYTGNALAAVKPAKHAKRYQSGGRYYKEVTKVLKKYKGVYSKQLYRTLILAMIAAIQNKADANLTWDDLERDILSQEGEGVGMSDFLDDPFSINDKAAAEAKSIETDICYAALIYNLDDLPGSETESINILCSHFFKAEKAYLKGSSVSLTDYDLSDSQSNGLKLIIQSTIYGTGFEKVNTYSEDEARSYRAGHSNLIEWDDFADAVAGQTYQAVKVKNGMDHIVEF